MSPKWTTTEADGEVDIRLEAEGPASLKPVTVFQVLEETVKKYGDRAAMRYKRVPPVSNSGAKGGSGKSSRLLLGDSSISATIFFFLLQSIILFIMLI